MKQHLAKWGRGHTDTLVGVIGILFAHTAPAAFGQLQSEDGVWRFAANGLTATAEEAELRIRPLAYRTALLDEDALANRLGGAVLALPLPDGTFQRFRIEASPVMHPNLAARFPQIRTFRGRGLDQRDSTVRFDWTPHGFHAQIFSPAGAAYVDPMFRGGSTYAVYWKRDYASPGGQVRRCWVDSAEAEPTRATALGGSGTAGPELRTYRLAVAATGEYTAFHGGTVLDGMSAVVTAINRVNQIYETEVGIRMELVPNNDSIVFTDGATDPYTNLDGFQMLNQNQSTINAIIGSANYDIGHVFSTGGGGVAALGVVCGGSKARGVTGLSSPIGDPFYVDFVAHEMGHQYRGNHTFNGNLGSCCCGNRNGSTAYEPGSGSTIMAYAGICGSDNLQPNSDAYFHAISFTEIRNFTTAGLGSVCAVTTATGNNPPTVSAGPDYAVPANTPFVLTAFASDPDNDPLTFGWEELDLGPAFPLSQPDQGTIPLFRFWPPESDPSRTFPRMSDLLNNTTAPGEQLPATNRTMTFRVTARDNRLGGGGIASDDMLLNVSSLAGPFEVTSPQSGDDWFGDRTVRWEVAFTDVAPVSALTVNILLSTDGGQTFDTVLASDTPNDGAEGVVLPNIETTTARIKVEAADNIFFAVSNGDFNIGSCVPQSTAPPAEPSAVEKGRFLSFQPNANGPSAYRVTLADLPAPFDVFNGETRWVGEPQMFADPAGAFYAAPLQCEPVTTSWDVINVVHVYGGAIVPGATYEIQSAQCDPTVETNLSPPLTVSTGLLGDVVEPFAGPGELQPEFEDVVAVVDAFRQNPASVGIPRVKLQPNVPDPSELISFRDIQEAVGGFQQKPYPFAGPVPCP